MASGTKDSIKVQQNLRSKHIRTLEVLQTVVEENALLKKQLIDKRGDWEENRVLRQQLSDLQDELATNASKMNVDESSLMRAELLAVKTAAAEKAQIDKSEIKSLQSQLNDTQNINKHLKTEVIELKAKIGNLSVTSENIEQIRNELRHSKDCTEKLLKEQAKEAAAARRGIAEIESLNARLKGQEKRNIEMLKEIESLRSQIKKTNEDFSLDVEKRIKKTKALALEKKKLQELASALRLEVDTLRNTSERSKIDGQLIQKQLESLISERDEWRDEAIKLRGENERLKALMKPKSGSKFAQYVGLKTENRDLRNAVHIFFEIFFQKNTLITRQSTDSANPPVPRKKMNPTNEEKRVKVLYRSIGGKRGTHL